jgi:membrane-associated phospholipid phosphatase
MQARPAYGEETMLDLDQTLNSHPVHIARRTLLSALMLTGVALGLLAIFGELAEDVTLKQNFAWDTSLMLIIHQLVNPGLTAIMSFVTQFGESIAIVLAIGLALWFWWRRQSIDAATLLISFTGGMALSTIFKLALARLRPALFPPLVIEHSYSFPSGHSVAVVALYSLLAGMLWQHHQRGSAVVLGALIVIVDFSRVYLGVHYPSDVLGGFALGTLWLMIVLAARTQARRT